MEVDNNNQVPKWAVLKIVEHQRLAKELDQGGPTIFDEYSLTLHIYKYDKEARKVQIEKIHVKDKMVT